MKHASLCAVRAPSALRSPSLLFLPLLLLLLQAQRAPAYTCTANLDCMGNDIYGATINPKLLTAV